MDLCIPSLASHIILSDLSLPHLSPSNEGESDAHVKNIHTQGMGMKEKKKERKG